MSSEYQAKSHSKAGQPLASTSTTDRAEGETKNSGLSGYPEKTAQNARHSQQTSPPNPAHAPDQMETVSEGRRTQLLVSDMPLKIQEALNDIHNWPRIDDLTSSSAD
jgi:hypothetical protein